MSNKKIKINNTFIILLLLIPFFEPEYINSQVSSVNNIYNICKYCSLAIVLFIYIYNKKISKYILVIACYNLIILFATFLNDKASINLAISNTIDLIGISLIMELVLRENPKKLIDCMLLILEILIYINFITIIKYPDGMYADRLYTNNWFLGYDNKHIITILPAIAISLIYSLYYGDKLKLRTVILIIVSIATVMINFSATSVVAIILMTIFVIFRNKLFNNTKIFNFVNYIIVYLALFFFIVIFRMQEKFSYIIVNLLHKNLTFTGRTDIWDKVIGMIKDNFIIGYGTETAITRASKIGNILATHSHNTILEILYKGGIIALGMYVYLIIIVGKKIMKYKHEMATKVITFTIFVFFIMMIVEARDVAGFYILLLLGYNIQRIVENIRDFKKNKNENV